MTRMDLGVAATIAVQPPLDSEIGLSWTSIMAVRLPVARACPRVMASFSRWQVVLRLLRSQLCHLAWSTTGVQRLPHPQAPAQRTCASGFVHCQWQTSFKSESLRLSL